LKLNAKEKMSSLRVKRKFSKKHKESIWLFFSIEK
jgi:hypothetical protein